PQVDVHPGEQLTAFEPFDAIPRVRDGSHRSTSYSDVAPTKTCAWKPRTGRDCPNWRRRWQRKSAACDGLRAAAAAVTVDATNASATENLRAPCSTGVTSVSPMPGCSGAGEMR